MMKKALLPEQKAKKGRTFVFLGVDYTADDDVTLTERVLKDIIAPRRGKSTGLGLDFCPLSSQVHLDEFIRGDADGTFNESDFLSDMENTGVDRALMTRYLPLLAFARKKNIDLVALAPERADVEVVRRDGLQNVDLERRGLYVADVDGFVQLTTDPKFRLYTDRSLLKEFKKRDDKDGPGDYFAERILVDEAVATSVARWALGRPADALMVVVGDLRSYRFFGGANGRIPRVCRFLSPGLDIDEESVTTILLNPSAEETLSQSRFLRLEIGTSPENLQYQTKLADYIWFSEMPKVNMLPRLMTGI
eukprot:CAMPEP_0172509328 /NCGR_PEP_ID=MMETSP1066-20121228/219384_1 /TAXON_ID=671091 /ORGANISM="Coscinodiscus wailesii, Strain CCMP2513" /LENGTH=305 /DNA_ID=CAMNT_0013287749 /DNA_START=549 /DNA_END=1466 /DNA_ORIENTATION=-